MKNIVLLLVMVFSVATNAQVPQGVSYQAIALNSSGNPVVNTLIGVRLSILDNSASGSEIYKETHTTTTSDRGLYNLVIGQGSPVSGQFPLIDWGTNTKFLKVELDVAGGTNYVLSGTTQLWSVPYALYSERANSVDAANVIGETGTSYASGFLTDTNAYYIYNGINDQPNEWIQQPISGQPIDVAANYYTVGFLTSTNAYACTVINSGSDTSNTYPQWFPKQLSGTPLKMIIANESIGVLTSTHAYIFTHNVSATNVVTYTWSSQALSGTPKDIYAFGNSCIGVVTDTNAYAYARTILMSSPEANGSWYSTPISGTVLQVRPTVQVFSVYTSTHAYSLVPIFTSVGNTASEWKSVQMNGNYIDSSK